MSAVQVSVMRSMDLILFFVLTFYAPNTVMFYFQKTLALCLNNACFSLPV